MDFITNLIIVADSALSVFLFNFWSVVSKDFNWVIVTGCPQSCCEFADRSRHCIQVFLKFENFFVSEEKGEFPVVY